MRASTFSFTLAALVAASFATPLAANWKRGNDFFAPKKNGGSQLGSFGGDGEPMNIIISGQSSPEVLTDDGFLKYAQSLGFAIECLGIHKGDPMQADLGDGNGKTPQLLELREDFGVSFDGIGTCFESLLGGNHLRMWRQNGTQGDSGALFLAVSSEKNVVHHHDIEDDGYDKRRDSLVVTATGSTTAGSDGVTYSATANQVSGLLDAGSNGINHGITQDGKVTVLTVTVHQ